MSPNWLRLKTLGTLEVVVSLLLVACAPQAARPGSSQHNQAGRPAGATAHWELNVGSQLPTVDAEDNLRRRDVDAALPRLNAKQQNVLALRFGDGAHSRKQLQRREISQQGEANAI